MNHASKLRAEATHDTWKRQLRALSLAFLLAAAAPRSFADAPSGSTAAEELRAAKLLESALVARQAGAEEWQKLDRIYADMAAKFPTHAAVKNGYAEFLWSIDERRRATALWEAAEKLEPGNAAVLDRLGECHLAAGEIRKAASYFSRAIEIAPTNASYHFDLANVVFTFRHELLDSEKPTADIALDHALRHFAEASRLEPLNVEYARAYAETFYNLPKPDWSAALAAWKHFLEISPQKSFALLNLARVHMKLGQKAEARSCLAKVQGQEYDRLKTRLGERIDSE